MQRPLFYRLSDPHAGRDMLTNEIIKQTVIADVQRLLRTRYVGEQRKSRNILNYGLPSVVNVGSNSSNDLADMIRNIEEIIEEYEPRLRNVEVQLAGGKSWNTRSVQITGDLYIDEEPERFVFHAQLDD